MAPLLAVLLLGGLLAACAPEAPPAAGPSAQFCKFYNKVAQEPPAPDSAVLVKNDVVAMAEDTEVTGANCNDPAAKVELDGAVLAKGQEVPEKQSEPNGAKVAAVTGAEIAAGSAVLNNLTVDSLSAEIGTYGIRIKGNVRVKMSGVTSTIGFTGTMANLENWSVTLSSSALSIPGITTTPATFSGTLRSVYGVTSLSLAASVGNAQVGDVSLNNATVNLEASAATGVTASVAGTIKVGPSTASGVVHVEFDRFGALVAANGSLSARLVGTQADGSKIDFTGDLVFEGNGDKTVASFSGGGTIGDMVVLEANGTITLQPNKATLVGVLDIEQGADRVRFNGSIVWDGVAAYAPTLQIQGAGEFSGTMADGKTVSVKGTISTEVIGGQPYSVVTGEFLVGTLKATGHATIDTQGSTTVLELSAELVDAGFSANLAGVIVLTDGLAETVSLDAAVNGSVNLGDATLTSANLHIASSYGSPLELRFTGGLKIGAQANLTGTVLASFGPDGSLLSLTGNVNGSLQLDSWALVNFSGSVVVSPEQVTLTGSGGVSLINFPLGINFNGSLTSSLTNPSWSLDGVGRFQIASISVASARVHLSQGDGMKATRVGFYFSILGIPTYLEGNFHLKPMGGCSKLDLTGGSFLARPIASLVLPGVIGCPVNY